MGTDNHDRIDLRVIVDASVEQAWAFVSEPGWYINEGALVDHEISWNDSEVTVVDADHGRFVLRREAVDPPRYLRDSSTVNEHGDVRRVEFWVSAGLPGELRVVETGFASMHGSVEDQRAQHEQNTRTWRRQLELAQQRLAEP